MNVFYFEKGVSACEISLRQTIRAGQTFGSPYITDPVQNLYIGAADLTFTNRSWAVLNGAALPHHTLAFTVYSALSNCL